MSAITLTPEVIGIVANIVILIGGFLKLESRLTKLETTQTLMLDGMINTKQVDRRKDSANKKPAD
jgi:hypothetical protein